VELLRKRAGHLQASSQDMVLVVWTMMVGDKDLWTWRVDGEMDLCGCEVDDWTLPSIDKGLFGTIFDCRGAVE
jgi:hypothetical protein